MIVKYVLFEFVFVIILLKFCNLFCAITRIKQVIFKLQHEQQLVASTLRRNTKSVKRKLW